MNSMNMIDGTRYWGAFWDSKATSETDFQATGRSLMDIVGFLYTVNEVGRLLAPQKTDVLIDVGCGTGLISLALAHSVRHIYAMDISLNMVERARRNLGDLENISVMSGSLTSIGTPDSSAEKCLAYSVLQYLANEDEIADAFREIFRVLRPGGRALLAANPDPGRRNLLEQVIRERPDKMAASRELALQDIVVWIDPRRLCELGSKTGFDVRVEPIHSRIWQHFYMFNLVLDKP